MIRYLKNVLPFFMQIVPVTVCSVVWTVIASVFREYGLSTSLQVAILFFLLYRYRQKGSFRFWEATAWLVFFPCAYLYAVENGYQTGWYSRVSDVLIMGISGPLGAVAKLFMPALKTATLMQEHHSLLLYQMYSIAFFLLSTVLVFLKKSISRGSFVIFRKYRKGILLILILVMALSVTFHFMVSETDRAFRYAHNMPLWNFSLGYLFMYFLFFLLFICFKKRMGQTPLMTVMIMVLVLFFPVISVSSTIIETYRMDDGQFRAGREVMISPLFHAFTTTVITFFEDASVGFTYMNTQALRQYTLFQISVVLLLILPFLAGKPNQSTRS